MKKTIFLALMALVLVGCNDQVYTKTKIVFKCVDGKLLADTYLYLGENKNEDVMQHSKHKNELVLENGIKIWCKNTKENK